MAARRQDAGRGTLTDKLRPGETGLCLSVPPM